MSKKRSTRRTKDTFLPGPGQGAEDPDADFLLQCFVVLLQAIYGLVSCVAVVLIAVVRFVCWDVWQTKDKK